MERYFVKLNSKSPLLMHADDIVWRDEMEKWRKDPVNKKEGKAGDDRSPAFGWLGCLYHEKDSKGTEVIGLPSDNLMTCIRDGATSVPAGNKKTFKSMSQSGILVDDLIWPLIVDGHSIPWNSFKAMALERDFEAHKALAKEHGFELFLKSARIGNAKHIRVRPRFNVWSAQGTITVYDAQITPEILERIFFMAGNYCGVGDWRPKAPKSPGQYGRFDTEIKKL